MASSVNTWNLFWRHDDVKKKKKKGNGIRMGVEKMDMG